MRIEGSLDDMRIVGPVLRPYRSRDFSVCPACGACVSGLWRRTLRKIRGKRDEVVVEMRYCQGDKPPSEENPNKLAWMMFGEKNIVHGCAGIPGPHLHCTCKLCRADWYTALKEAR